MPLGTSIMAGFDPHRIYGPHGLLVRMVGRFPLFSLVSRVEFTEEFSSEYAPWKLELLKALEDAQ